MVVGVMFFLLLCKYAIEPSESKDSKLDNVELNHKQVTRVIFEGDTLLIDTNGKVIQK